MVLCLHGATNYDSRDVRRRYHLGYAKGILGRLAGSEAITYASDPRQHLLHGTGWTQTTALRLELVVAIHGHSAAVMLHAS